MDNELEIYHRKLPHWRLTGAVYFVTWRLHHLQHELAAEERSIIMAALSFFDSARYELHAFVGRGHA